MTITKTFVRKHYLITLPQQVRKVVHIQEGDPVEVCVKDNGEIVIHPLKTIDSSQAWFWDREHQAKEKEAENELKQGLAKKARSVKHLIHELNK